jgi:hypothetical protein
MVKTLERAIAEVANLPEAAQEKIGQELLAHVERLRNLRTESLAVSNRSTRAPGASSTRRSS